MTTAAIIVAAGRGRRFGAETPKQYVPIAGVCALRRSMDAFLALPQITAVQVVTLPEDAEAYRGATAGLADARLLPPVTGGETRGASVRNGLEALALQGPAKVLIHDAARPFVSARIITDIIAALDQVPGAFAALPVVDALWRAKGHAAQDAVPRDGLWRAQTPQGFHFDAILQAHLSHDGQGLDDVAVARDAGLEVRVIEGDERNFKITTPGDLDRALQEVARAEAAE